MRLVPVVLLVACATTSPAVRPGPQAPSASEPARPHGETQTQVLPGDSVGPVHAGSTHDQLVERLGADSVADQTIDLGEGVTANGTVLYAGTERELHVVWTSDDRSHVDRVHVVGTAWELPEGLHVGASLDALTSALGPLSFHGFGWDGAGTVLLDDTPLAKHADTLYLRLHATGEVAPSLMGDEVVGSDRPEVAAARLVLGEVRVRVQ